MWVGGCVCRGEEGGLWGTGMSCPGSGSVHLGVWVAHVAPRLPCRDHFIIFSGGMPRASYGDRHCVSVLRAETLVTLDFTSRIIDFFTVHSTRPEDGVCPALPTPCPVPPHPRPVALLTQPSPRRVRRAPGPGCVARRGAGGARPANAWLACCACPLPGPAALVCYHLLGTCRQRPRQAVGPHCERRRAAEPPACLQRLGVCPGPPAGAGTWGGRVLQA